MPNINTYGMVVIDYTNWRGERRERMVRPLSLQFTDTKWHPEVQWMLMAEDEGVVKGFAMKGIHSWRPA